MNVAPPDRMERDAIVAEIGELHGELQARLVRIQGLSQSLYQRVRRAPADDNTAVYMRFAQTWQRFAGMAMQGSKRAKVGDRILKALVGPESIVKSAPIKPPAAASPMQLLLDLYGDEDTADDFVSDVAERGVASEPEPEPE